ncbi:MAG: DNA-binding protein [Desulfobaccales bacterium]
MIRPYRLLVSLSLLSLVLAASSWGQPDTQGGPSGLYNPATVATVSGIVIAKTPPSTQGLPQLVYLTLKTASGRITIFLGPDLNVDKLPVQIQNLDKIQVTGSEITWEGKPVILAATIIKGDQVLKLREPNGVPVWAGQRQTRP